jgi:hypothetical protein
LQWSRGSVNQLDIDVEVLAVFAVPRKGNLIPVWRKTRLKFATRESRERYYLRGGLSGQWLVSSDKFV